MTNGNIILCGKDVKHQISSYETIHKHICVSRACYQTFTNRNAVVLGIICIFAETLLKRTGMKHYRITKTIAAALLSLACSTACAQQGAWSGDLNVMGTKLPLVFIFSADGCTLDSPAQGAKDIPAQKSGADVGSIKVTGAMIGATFEGKREGDCINGTFAQGALQLPLTLKR